MESEIYNSENAEGSLSADQINWVRYIKKVLIHEKRSIIAGISAPVVRQDRA